ncbi:MAG: histidine triad nucleotide-binding protein [Candidatus Omnitrophota bacterium]|nr:MAG: histidine triad nucleotide-binding protein [Candidatus Omnitrophota bacterium]HDN98038.1 histidine triad nucleotide-binding protein [bacterium]
MEDCIFCKIAKGSVSAKVVYEDDEFIAFHDINPQAPVHILIIPKKHIPRLCDTEDKELLGKMLILANKIAEKMGILEDGYRVVINTNRNAGQTIDHLHLHLLGGRIMNWPPG